MVGEVQKQTGWESVWTSIKKVKFDDFMWEDGSKFSGRRGKFFVRTSKIV